jgi:hypothetical protein
MQDVPKIVRDRLQRPGSVPAESHPDADLLTAFAEQSLAAGEREHVMQHLAQCGDCREIVHLALPATEAVAPAESNSRARTGWLRWPALRWGLVAAGILAVTSVGVLQFRQRQEKAQVATRLVPREQLASSERSAPLSPSTPPPPTSSQPTSSLQLPAGEAGKLEMRKKAITARALSDDKATTTANAVFPRSNQFHGGAAGGIGAGSSVGASIGGSIRRDVAPDRTFPNAPAGQSADQSVSAKQSSPVPAAREVVEVAHGMETVEVSGAAPLAQTEVAAQNATQDQLAQNQSAVKLQSSGKQTEAVVRAKPTLPQVNGMAAAADLRNYADAKSPALRWTIGANGALQRSLDEGKTWLEVNLAADGSMNSNLVSQSNSQLMVAKNSAARTATKAEAKSSSAPAPPSPVVFRALAVSSNAAEVWAGGSAGVLYHTMDGGNLWVRVVPSEAGVALTGDIVSIQFSDPRNGTLTTSNAAAWTTNDNGQTWHKQQ